MRVPLIHPTDERQVPDLRAVPVSPRTPQPFRPAYPGVSADVLPWLRAADTSWSALGMRQPVAPQPIPLTDWSARIAKDFGHINSALVELATRTARILETECRAEVVAWRWVELYAADLQGELAPFADAVKAGGSL